MTTTNEQNKQAHDSVQQNPVDEPLKPSRAQFDFPSDVTPKEDEQISETAKKLLQLNSENTTEETASEPQSEQPSTEEVKPEDTNNNLPTLEELDLPGDVGLPEQPVDVNELPDTPEAKKFAEDFQKYLGFSVDEFRQASKDYQQTIQYINQVRAEQYKIQAQNTLANDWGVDTTEVQSRLEKVKERFNKYPQDMQERLDNVEGAKLIWAKIEQEQGLQSNNTQVPQFQRSTQRTAPRQQPMFTQRELDNMSPDEYQRNADRILRAYQLGLVQQ